MTQQTAVEWLYDQLVDTKFKENATKDILEQAKQMEKKQHDNTWVDSRIEDRGEGFIGKEKSFEQYYNETYNKKD